MNYRHECKFLVNSADLELIRNRIKHILRPDVHQAGKSGYIITSLYFDNINDQCWYENIQGYDNRHKYRLRIYDQNNQLIKLERKSKHCGLGNKTAVLVSQEECCALMQNIIPRIRPETDAIKKQLFCELSLEGMRPNCIVRYKREAFVYPAGNVRVTFDKDICGSRDVSSFLSNRIDTVPVLGEDIHVLEVKYDAFLPGFIAEALGVEQLRQTSISKYAQTRNILG